MAVERRTVVSRAPGGSRDLPYTHRPGLLCQAASKVEVPGSRPWRWHSTPGHHFRTDFIASTTYSNSTMHYDVGHARLGDLSKAQSPPL